MKKIKLYIIILLIGVTGIIISCGDDFLDRQPLSNVTPEQYLWEEAQLAAYAINQYSILPTHSNAGNGFGTFGKDVATDNMANLTQEKKYAPGELKVAQSGGEWDFKNIYKINYFISTVVPRWKEGKITGTQANVNHYIGEMYFLRAFEYFAKVQALGDFPIVKTILPDEMNVLTEASKRSPRSEVVRFIISDLDSAITLMSDVSPDGLKNRLSKACGQLLKSRVALYEATWLKYFKGTAFVPNGPEWPGTTKDYNKNYQFKAGSIDAETTWLLGQAMSSAQAVADAYGLETNNGVLQQAVNEPSNPYFNMFGATDMSKFSEVLLWRKYDNSLDIVNNVAIQAAWDNYTNGQTKGMVDAFLMANGLPIYAAGSGYHGDDYIADVRNLRDGRLWLFLKEPGQINLFTNAAVTTHATPVEPIPDLISAAHKYCTGYTIRKGINYDGYLFINNEGYVGSIVFRAVEAYLNYIEACYEKNGSLDGKADQYWKAIRTRARVDADYSRTIAATVLAEEAKGDWGAYSAGKMVDATLYNIRRERRCELMAEGLREMDLKRWRAMDQMVATSYHIEGFKLWGPMQEWYKDSKGKLTIKYGTTSSTVSSPSISKYLRPYEITGKEIVYNGYRWAMAHYLSPIAIKHFQVTGENGDVTTSPIYQNPGWPIEADAAPVGFQKIKIHYKNSLWFDSL